MRFSVCSPFICLLQLKHTITLMPDGFMGFLLITSYISIIVHLDTVLQFRYRVIIKDNKFYTHKKKSRTLRDLIVFYL